METAENEDQMDIAETPHNAAESKDTADTAENIAELATTPMAGILGHEIDEGFHQDTSMMSERENIDSKDNAGIVENTADGTVDNLLKTPSRKRVSKSTEGKDSAGKSSDKTKKKASSVKSESDATTPAPKTPKSSTNADGTTSTKKRRSSTPMSAAKKKKIAEVEESVSIATPLSLYRFLLASHCLRRFRQY
jgi:cobalamin biosynthesis Mg chelatase CobN